MDYSDVPKLDYFSSINRDKGNYLLLGVVGSVSRSLIGVRGLCRCGTSVDTRMLICGTLMQPTDSPTELKCQSLKVGKKEYT
jgi:hypothetical protein